MFKEYKKYKEHIEREDAKTLLRIWLSDCVLDRAKMDKEAANDKKQPEEAPGQAEAAAALDMSQGVYSMMESGRAVLNKCELVKAMTYYDVPAEKIYPPDILRLCFGIDAAEKKRKPTSAMVKIPIALAERIDGLITEGLYLSRTDFVAAATREKLGGDSNGQNAQEGRVVPIQLPEGQGA